jgi:hypothetical protein
MGPGGRSITKLGQVRGMAPRPTTSIGYFMSGGLRTGRRRERQRPTPSTALQTPVALCGGGELKGAEDEEEAMLTAPLASFWHGPTYPPMRT